MLGDECSQNLHRFADAEVPALLWGCASVMHAADLCAAEGFTDAENLEATSFVGSPEGIPSRAQVNSFLQRRDSFSLKALEALMLRLVGSARCLEPRHVHLLQVRQAR